MLHGSIFSSYKIFCFDIACEEDDQKDLEMASSLSLLTREIEDLLIAYVSLFIFCDHKGKTRNKSFDYIKTKTLSLSDIEKI